MELWLLSFEERDKFTLQRVEGKQQNWWWIPPPPVLLGGVFKYEKKKEKLVLVYLRPV